VRYLRTKCPLSQNHSSSPWLDKAIDGAATEEKFDRFYNIDGDYFVLRYSEITTLNIEFIKVEDVQP